MIKITQQAIDAILDKYNFTNNDQSIRIFIKGFSWGGPKFGITLDRVTENDFVLELETFNVIVEKEIIDLYGEFSIDFLDTWIGKDFIVLPNKGQSSC